MAALLLAACSSPSQPDPTPPAEHDFVRVRLGAPGPALWDVTGSMVVVNDQIDAEANWASLRSGTVEGVKVPFMIHGNRPVGDATSRPGAFWWYLNPNIDRPGTFRPGDCQLYAPAFQNCARMRLTVGSSQANVDAVIDAIADSVVITVTEYGANQIRASATGRFLYAPVGGAAQHVDGTVEVEVARYKTR